MEWLHGPQTESSYISRENKKFTLVSTERTRLRRLLFETDRSKSSSVLVTCCEDGVVLPHDQATAQDSGEPAMGQGDRDEELARISELARRLGFNDAKTKMLLGQWVGNLAALERKLS